MIVKNRFTDEEIGELDIEPKANLSGANLSRANLSGADLSEADLSEADLRWADLSRADLSEANLDFSCWPLWCGSQDVKIDKRLARQLLAHAFNAAKEFIKPTSEQAEFINQFHRILSEEFPVIEAATKGKGDV